MPRDLILNPDGFEDDWIFFVEKMRGPLFLDAKDIAKDAIIGDKHLPKCRKTMFYTILALRQMPAFSIEKSVHFFKNNGALCDCHLLLKFR